MCNIGNIDKIARALVGIGLVVAAFLTSYWWLSIVGAILVVTALISFCPLYALLKLNTGCPESDD